MLVSTLVLILIGFMVLVLFSMIPVVWRLRADNFCGDEDQRSERAPECTTLDLVGSRFIDSPPADSFQADTAR